VHEPRLVAGRLRAQLTVTLVRPLGPVTIPLALLRCGKQATVVPLASRRAARVGKKLGLTLASSTAVPTCRGHRATVHFRIETPSIYLLSAVEALH
jgi:hypothetical protein